MLCRLGANGTLTTATGGSEKLLQAFTYLLYELAAHGVPAAVSFGGGLWSISMATGGGWHRQFLVILMVSPPSALLR